MSATEATVGGRRLRVPMPASWTSASMGSVRRATATVGTVFRCVASRNRERVFYWGSLRLISNRACGQKSGSASLASHTPSGPNPLGENQSLSSPPLKPRGLLLFVMRQKVGKEHSQGVCAPLAIPPRLGSESPTEKIRPCAHTLEAVHLPGWSAQRHRRGRQCKASRQAHLETQPKLRPHAFLRAIPPRRGGRPVASPRDGSATFAPLICARAGDGPKNRSAHGL